MKNNLLKIYKILNKRYGQRNWWPTTLEGELHPKYHGKKPTDKQRFEIVVGAILTQNTSWRNVEKAILNLNKEKLIDVEKLSKINIRKLARIIKPAGYYNQKAWRLKTIANYFLRNPNILKTKNVKKLRERLLSIKGIGPETADSIILYAAEKPIFVIDAYTKRIFSRLGFCNEKCGYDELQNLFMNNLRNNTKLFNNYHAVLIELAKEYCRKKPKCTNCILKSICKFGKIFKVQSISMA